MARMQLLKLTHGAVAREPALRERSGEWWARERQEGEWGTQDDAVRAMAAKVGLGIDDDEGAFRKRARAAIETLKSGYRPSEYL